MINRLILLSLCLGLFTTASAEPRRFSLGGFGGKGRLTSGELFEFKPRSSYGITLGHRLTDRWSIDLDVSWLETNNDTSTTSDFTLGSLTRKTEARFESTRMALVGNRLLLDPQRWVNIHTGLGAGVMSWKVVDPSSNTAFTVEGDKQVTTDFSASELFLTATTGLTLQPTSGMSVSLSGSADYLTGGGAEFSSDVRAARDRLLLSAGVRFKVHFGSPSKSIAWRSDEIWPTQPTESRKLSDGRRDSDGDGVSDEIDRCYFTVRGAEVDRYGCPRDSDHDGVSDGLDDCPGTLSAAIGRVDIFGCAIDSDFDGSPDFVDNCPNNPVGAITDSNGCPIDTDRDGVPDGLDDCPYSLAGTEVDQYGCIDLAMFASPMVLHIDYAPGSFEIDPNTRERIKKLATVLNFVETIRLDIYGYTDNIGRARANQTLSEKRARRVRDFLAANGIAKERMKAAGKGETEFMASNDTSDGRRQNRRIEITFYR
ncbi:MAG: OmpA family protein [candidate division Zixibacteria bacterium]